MKWMLIEIDNMGRERLMPTVYTNYEEAKRDREIFLWENENKGCKMIVVEREEEKRA